MHIVSENLFLAENNQSIAMRSLSTVYYALRIRGIKCIENANQLSARDLLKATVA